MRIISYFCSELKIYGVKYYRYLLLIFIFSLISSLACRRSVDLPEAVEADYIKYNVHYFDKKAGDVPTKILPSTMDAYYTRYFVLTKIEGFFGQFSLIQIANLKTRKVSTLLNFFGNKVYYTGENKELPAGIEPIYNLHLTFTDDTLYLAGLLSHRIEVLTGDSRYSIYYTKQIDAKRPNITTPYSNINYVLSDFRIQLSYLKMHLTCTSYEKSMIKSESFLIPDDYRPVSRQAMEEIINSLFTKD